MAEYETETGATVREYGRAVVPRDTPNQVPDDLGSTTGPSTSGGPVMYGANLPMAPGAQPWAGWPVDWNVPSGPGAEWLVQRTATVGTCADTIGRTIATFPPRVMRGDELAATQPLWTQNPEPDLYASFDEWIRLTVNSLLIGGEAFLYSISRNFAGYPSAWATLNPYHVKVEWDDGLTYSLNEIPLETMDVLHIKYTSVPGQLRGCSPLDWIARNTLTASSLAQFAQNLADSGGVPWGVLTHPGHLRAGQAEELRDQWQTAQSMRGGAPAILSGGMTLQTLAFSPESMALLSLREFDEQRIAAGMGVPAMFVGLPQPAGLNYTSTEMLADFFYRNTLKPLTRTVATAVSGWALPRGTNLVFDASDYLAPTLSELIGALVNAAGVGAVTTDEIRRAIGLPRNMAAPMPDPLGVT